MIVNDIFFKGNTMIIKDTFGKIEIIKDNNVKEPTYDLNYILYKLQNSTIKLTIYYNNIIHHYKTGNCYIIRLPFYNNYKIIANLNPTTTEIFLHLNFNYIYVDYLLLLHDFNKVNIRYIDSLIKFYKEE